MRDESGCDYVGVSIHKDGSYYSVIIKLEEDELYWLPALGYYEVQELEQQLIDTANKIRDYRLAHPIKTKDVQCLFSLDDEVKES